MAALQIVLDPCRIAAGDSLPAPAATLRGLAADPNGVTATFELWRRGELGPLEDDVAATAESVVDGARWNLTLTATGLDMAALEAGEYFGRFRVVLPQGLMTVPPDGALRILVSA